MRYRVLDLPVKGASAFMPLPTMNGAASSGGLQVVMGAPGTDPMPSPSPQADYLPSLTAQGGVNSAQPSSVAPDVILPSIYVASAANMGPEADAGIGMAARRRTPIPVPALNYPRVPSQAMDSARIGGRRTMLWPRPFQRYPPATVPS